MVSNRGFTLIELMVVVAIILVLSTLLLASAGLIWGRTDDFVTRARMSDIQRQLLEVDAADARKVDVEQHRVDGVVFQLGKRRLDIVRRRLEMPRFFEGHAQNVSYDRIVFYNQDMHGLNSHITFEQFKPDSGGGFPWFRTFEKPALIDKQTVIYLVQSLN